MSKYKEQVRPFSSHEILVDRIPSGSSVLDIGCGTGYFAMCLQKRGCVVVGIDNDKRNIEHAKQRGIAAEHTDVNDSLTFAKIIGDRKFDYVICADVLEHLASPANTLQCLRPYIGKALFVSIPNVGHWSVRFQLLLGRWRYTETGILDQTHIWFFTHETACQLLRQSGYVIVHEDCTPHPMVVPQSVYGRVWPHRFNYFISHLRPSFLAMQFLFEARP